MSSNLRYPSPGGHGRRQDVDAESVSKAYGNGTALSTSRGHGKRMKPTVTRVQSKGLPQRSGHGRRNEGTGSSKATHIKKSEPTHEVAKLGDWKTIGQREDSQARSRRRARHGRGMALAGAGVAGAGVARGGARDLARAWVNDGFHRGAGMGRVKRAKAVGGVLRRSSGGGLLAGGVALAGLGGVQVARGRTGEAYQQHKINQRRKQLAKKPVTKALIPSSMLASASQVSSTGTAKAKKATAPKAPAGLTGQAGVPGVSKAYDPEGKRHRRAGLVGGAAVLGGGLLLHRGVKGAVASTKQIRKLNAFEMKDAEGKTEIYHKYGSLKNGVAASPGDAKRVGGGAALVGAGGGAYAYGGTRRGKSWS